MELLPLSAISPVDGRYRSVTEPLDDFFSEYALIRYRLLVELEYFFFLADKKFFSLPASTRKSLRELADHFNPDQAWAVKKIEATTNHDVKAVEYYIKSKLDECGSGTLKEWVHFGLTSQDVNNTALPLILKHFIETYYLPALLQLVQELKLKATAWKQVAMLAKTHGQPASPTVLGKEIMVFVERLYNQINLLSQLPHTGKFGGATGNFNAHYVAFPKKNWPQLANEFLEKRLGLERQQYTTQIEHYDMLAAILDNCKRINTILLDLSRDIWMYISMEYFTQKTKKNEVGSSAMPHKVNPIDFENAEGNIGMANAIFEHLSSKLPVSRLQRDLTDSTVLRNLGVPFAHTIIAIHALNKGLGKLVLNPIAIKKDLDNNWAVVSEAIQTILRRENYPGAYEKLKELTRGNNQIGKKQIQTFIRKLKLPKAVEKEMLAITPDNYTGYPIR